MFQTLAEYRQMQINMFISSCLGCVCQTVACSFSVIALNASSIYEILVRSGSCSYKLGDCLLAEGFPNRVQRPKYGKRPLKTLAVK